MGKIFSFNKFPPESTYVILTHKTAHQELTKKFNIKISYFVPPTVLAIIVIYDLVSNVPYHKIGCNIIITRFFILI